MNSQYHFFQFNLAASDPFSRQISEDLLPERGWEIPQSLSNNSMSSLADLRLSKISSTPKKRSILNNLSLITMDEEIKATEDEIALDSYCKKIAFKELMEEYQEKNNMEEDALKFIKYDDEQNNQLPQLRQQQTKQASETYMAECFPIPDRSDSIKEFEAIEAGASELPSPIKKDGQRGRPPKYSLIGKAFQQKAVIRKMKTFIADDTGIENDVRRQFNDNLKFDQLLKEIKNCNPKIPNPASLLFAACYTSSKQMKEIFLRSDYGLIFRIMAPRLRQEYEGKDAIYNQIIDSFNDFAQQHQ